MQVNKTTAFCFSLFYSERIKFLKFYTLIPLFRNLQKMKYVCGKREKATVNPGSSLVGIANCMSKLKIESDTVEAYKILHQRYC